MTVPPQPHSSPHAHSLGGHVLETGNYAEIKFYFVGRTDHLKPEQRSIARVHRQTLCVWVCAIQILVKIVQSVSPPCRQ